MATKLRAFTIQYDGRCREIATEVTLINAWNPSLYSEYMAIWDTGAQRTVITKRIAKAIRCKATDTAQMVGVGSKPKRVDVYDVHVGLPNKVAITGVPVMSTSSIGGAEVDVLIGMDIITEGDFAITNYGQKTTVTFSTPPHRNKIDFVDRANQVNKKKGRR